MRRSHDIRTDRPSSSQGAKTPARGGHESGERVWNGRNVVLFLAVLMVLIAVAMAVAPGALLPGVDSAPPEKVPAEHHSSR